MIPRDTTVFFIATAFLLSLVLAGCGGYVLRYEPAPGDSTSQTVQPIAVAVLQLDDARPPEERVESERRKVPDSHLGDYTYDKEFRGAVNDGISRMIAAHLSHVRVFSKIDYIPTSLEKLSSRSYDSLQAIGVDAVLTGRIHNFFGYYSTDAGHYLIPLAFTLGFWLPPLLLMPSVREETYYLLGQRITVPKTDETPGIVSSMTAVLGSLIGSSVESSRDRDIQSRTNISFQLTSTQTRATFWTDTIAVYRNEHTAVPDMNKFDVAMQALNRASRELVTHLSRLSISRDGLAEPRLEDHALAHEEISLNEQAKPFPSQLQTALSFAAGFRPTNEVLGGMRVGFVRFPHDITVCVNFIYNYKGASLTVRQIGFGAEYLILRLSGIQVYSHSEMFFNILTPSDRSEYFRGGLGLDLGLTAPISKSVRLGLEANYQLLNLFGKSTEESNISEFTPILRILFDF